MAECAFCGLRKGKRRCPALDDAICSQCCGEHRLREIACPATCSWLGRLQAVVDPATATADIPEKDWNDAVDALFSTFDEALGAPYLASALEHFGVDDEAEEWMEPLLLSYAALALRDHAGYRLVDRYMESRGRDLAPAHSATILVLQRSWASLFEVKEIHTRRGLRLEDLITGAEHELRELDLATQVAAGDCLFAWLGERGDSVEITAGVCMVPKVHRDAVLADLEHDLEIEREIRPDENDGVLAAELAWQIVRTICERMANPSPAGAERSPATPEGGDEGVAEALREHYATWLDTELPALEGRSPRQAAAAGDAGRRSVARLLSVMEAHTLEMPGGDTVDFVAMWRELGLDYAPSILGEYRAEAAPDPALWMDLDEAERIELVEEFHTYLTGPHPEPENPRLHATLHVAVENQIAAGEPPSAAATVQRLMNDGLSRHEAIHAVCSVVAKVLFRAMRDHHPVAPTALDEELQQLDAADWAGSAPV